MIPTTHMKTPIEQTRQWLSTVVIGQNFCPFAKREHDSNRIHYTVVDTTDLSEQLERVVMECAALDQDTTRETTLLIFPNALFDFDDYLDALDMATRLLESQARRDDCARTARWN